MMPIHSLDPEDTARLTQELERGETLLWAAKPLRKVIFHASDWYLVPFSLLWGGFALFWETMAGGIGKFDFMTLWGIPFVVAGQYLIWGRFVYDAWQKQRMVYALTNERVLILRTSPRYKLQTGSLESLGTRTLTLRADGIGTIDLNGDGEMNPFGLGSRRNQSWSQLSRFAFVDIEDARTVERLITDQRSKMRKRVEGTSQP